MKTEGTQCNLSSSHQLLVHENTEQKTKKKQNKLQINSAKFILALAEGTQRHGEGTDKRNVHTTRAEPDRRHNAEQEHTTESQQSSNKNQHDKEANVSKTIHKWKDAG